MYSTALRFSYELVTPTDGMYGSLQEDGNFTGVVGMLQRDEADITVSPIGIAEVRRKFLNSPIHVTSKA